MLRAKKIKSNVWCLDTGYLRPNYTAAFLLISGESIALFDCGVNNSVEPLLQQIREIGFEPEQVKALCLTHAHLDHAGGAGRLMTCLPNATVYAHKDTIRHLIDPVNLEKSVRAVYGDDFYNRLYGSIFPLVKARCQVMEDGENFLLEGKKIQAVYTPGHAWHHHAFYCEDDSVVFAGDAFGLHLKLHDNLPFLFFPTTPPSQFHPEEMIRSFDKIDQLGAASVCVTHYGEILDTAQGSKVLTQLVHSVSELMRECYHLDDDALCEKWINVCLQQLHRTSVEKGCDWFSQLLVDFRGDAELNISGLRYWMKKQGELIK